MLPKICKLNLRVMRKPIGENAKLTDSGDSNTTWNLNIKMHELFLNHKIF